MSIYRYGDERQNRSPSPPKKKQKNKKKGKERKLRGRKWKGQIQNRKKESKKNYSHSTRYAAKGLAPAPTLLPKDLDESNIDESPQVGVVERARVLKVGRWVKATSTDKRSASVEEQR
jgi:hypothetical protein